jgi:hypothetical protein
MKMKIIIALQNIGIENFFMGFTSVKVINDNFKFINSKLNFHLALMLND